MRLLRGISKLIFAEDNDKSYKNNMVTLVLKIDEKMAYRVCDEFDEKDVVKNLDGSFTATVNFPNGDWIYGYVLSYGNYAEVIQPNHIREIIRTKLEEALKKYI